jgi:predicted RND superfamily exporter protein
VGLAWLVGLMGVVGLRFSLLNIAVLPIIVGVGVDNGVYLHASVSSDAGERAEDLEHGVRAILAATATSMVGFGALCIADSAGLRGIGWLSLLGIGLVTIAALLLVPALLRHERSGPRGHGASRGSSPAGGTGGQP